LLNGCGFLVNKKREQSGGAYNYDRTWLLLESYLEVLVRRLEATK
jgi:hypothetical protein